MKHFRTTHETFGTAKEFDEASAPNWLTSADSVPGSTMDGRWFWNDHVLTLEVGSSVQSDFHTITRIA